MGTPRAWQRSVKWDWEAARSVRAMPRQRAWKAWMVKVVDIGGVYEAETVGEICIWRRHHVAAHLHGGVEVRDREDLRTDVPQGCPPVVVAGCSGRGRGFCGARRRRT